MFYIYFILLFYISNLFSYQVVTEKYSYYLLDGNGTLVHSNGFPIKDERKYFINTYIDPKQTAIVVMDPWIDHASDFLNEYYTESFERYLLPLVQRAKAIGHQVIILTNDPSQVRYGTKIDKRLMALVDNKKVHLLYHHSFNDWSFSTWLSSRGINTLIYTGYASNMCIIARRMGMIFMLNHGYRLFFVPETSGAVETADTWDNGAIHKIMTTVISQWIGRLIHYDDFMKSTSNLSK